MGGTTIKHQLTSARVLIVLILAIGGVLFYDLEKIYITRTDIKYKPVVYSINQRELKQFFDTQLKGFYFGEDKVRES
ncbi:hypothetical protein D3C80_1377080 [compost metagenome]